MARPPSGEQAEIRFGNQRAVIVEVGGGLREYVVDGRHVLDGFGEMEMASSGRGQVLIPWPNRIQDGAYEFDGKRYQLGLSEAARHNASHGLVRWANWSVIERDESRVVMGYALHPQPGYPFSLDLSLAYELSDAGLSVTVTATNAGAEACPFGSGVHPYLKLGDGRIDGQYLQVPARTLLTADERGIPTGSLSVDGTEFDFRQPRPVGSLRLDHAYTSIERDSDGRFRVVLSDPSDGRSLTLWADEHYSHVMIFTGDTLAVGARQALAVEPMTCPPNAFRSGEGVIRLEPGESFVSAWGIAPG